VLYFIADWHALTSDYADTSAVAENTLQIMIDYLRRVGSSEEVFFSIGIPEHAELHLLLSMVTAAGVVERVPTYKRRWRTLGQGSAQLRVSWIPDTAVRGHCDLQSTRRGGQSGAALFVPVARIRSRTWRFRARL